MLNCQLDSGRLIACHKVFYQQNTQCLDILECSYPDFGSRNSSALPYHMYEYRLPWNPRKRSIAAPDSKEPAIIMRIQSLRQSIQECPDQDLRYTWLPRHCLLALACIACSVSLRPNGKVNKARQCLEAAARHMADGSADDDDEVNVSIT